MLVGETSNFFHVVTRTAAEKTVMFYVILITRENIERHSVHEKRNALSRSPKIYQKFVLVKLPFIIQSD